MTNGRHRASGHLSVRRVLLATIAVTCAAAVFVSLALLTDSARPSLAVAPAGPVESTSPSRPSAPVSRTATRVEAVTPGTMARVAAAGASQGRSRAHAPVLLVGDSLAVGIAAMLAAALPRRSLTVEALEGRTTATSVQLLAGNAAGTPPVWVVSLGTNDSPDAFGASARALLRLAGHDRCVLWFDVWRVSTDDAINAALRTLAETHANLHVLPWNALATAHPEWFAHADVHPSAKGYLARTRLASRAVERLCTAAG